MAGGNRQQGNVSRPLDRLGYFALVPRAVAGDSPWNDFPALANEGTERTRIFIIYGYLLVGTEPAYLSSLKSSLLSGSVAS